MCADKTRALLVVVSAPSGAGKTTLCDRLLAAREDMAYSVSCTTRQPRGRERDGEDYIFLKTDEFQQRVDAGLFLEYAEVHGFMYGTLRETVERALGNSKSLLMDIDVQGAAQIREKAMSAPDGDIIKDGFVDIFITPPSLQSLRERLESRSEDSPEVIAKRLKNAEGEMQRAGEYAHTVINDDLDVAFAELVAVLEAEACKK